MKATVLTGSSRSHWWRHARRGASWIALIAILVGSLGRVDAQSGHYVLVKKVIDRNKVSGTHGGSTVQGGEGSFNRDYQGESPNGAVKWTVHAHWSWNPPPSEFAPNQVFALTASGSISTTEPGGVAGSRFDCGGDITQEAPDNSAFARSDNRPSTTKTFHLKAPSGPRVRQSFEVNLGADGLTNDYYYEWRGGGTHTRSKLQARLDQNTVEVVRNQTAQSCHIIISGWRRNTADRVEVDFLKRSDGYGSQDKGGRTGIVVPIGHGSESVFNMSGSRGPDGSYGKYYQWTVFVRARGNAPVGTRAIPIVVRQRGAGQVKLTLMVRVLPGRSKQSGPRRDGSGRTTGGTRTRPPITRATSPTGLSARLSTGVLVLLPGQNSQTVTVFIRGWRTNTDDQVEVVLPQESKPRGNLGNDLVAFPGGGAIDPANMFHNNNGEFPYSFGIRAMERAPGVTTMIDIIVRQEGHEEVRLTLRVAVDAGGGGGGAGPGVRTRPNIPNNPGIQVVTPPGGGSGGGSAALDNAGRLAEEGNYAGAEAEFRKALHANPRSTDGWNGLGDACFKQGKWSDAEKAYRQSIRLEPTDGFLHAQLAESLLKQNRRDEAIKEAKEAIRLGLQDHEVFDELEMAGAP